MVDKQKIVERGDAEIKKQLTRTKKLAAEERKKRRNKVLLMLVFIAINVAVIVATAVNEFGSSENAAELSEVVLNGWLLIPAALIFAAAAILDIWKYKMMIVEMSEPGAYTNREAWKLARRTVLLGRYYDNVTPAAVGGQPFQIYYMHKNGKMPSGLATTIPIFGMISLQIGFMMIAVIVFLAGSLAVDKPALMSLAWVGLVFYAFWPTMIFTATFLPKVTTKIIKWVVKALAKLKIVKNREEALEKTEKEISEYVKSMKTILKSRKVFILAIVASIIYNILIAAIPWFVLTAFGGDVNFIDCSILTMAVSAAVYFIPTPGNSGAAEGTFYMVFSSLSTGYVFWAMLVWRLFSYYIYILMGPLTYLGIRLERKRERLTAHEK